MNFHVLAYNTASSISARKMNARYMLVVQATLSPGTFTRARRCRAARTIVYAQIKRGSGKFQGLFVLFKEQKFYREAHQGREDY